MAELADAPDLGSGVHDVQVQVLLSAVRNGRRCLNTTFSTIFFIFYLFCSIRIIKLLKKCIYSVGGSG